MITFSRAYLLENFLQNHLGNLVVERFFIKTNLYLLYINIWKRHKWCFIFLVKIQHPDHTCDFALYKLLVVFAVVVICLSFQTKWTVRNRLGFAYWSIFSFLKVGKYFALLMGSSSILLISYIIVLILN